MGKSCKGCHYRLYLTGNQNSVSMCTYMIVTGEPRNSDPDNCDKYTLRRSEKKRRKYHVDL